MSKHESIGSSAFQWLDANAESSLDYPDEAFDWVFMLTDRDWELLDKVWSSRSSLWREAVSYFVIDGPICASRPMLLRALHDSNEDVSRQAAISLCHQCIQYPDLSAELDAETVDFLHELVARSDKANMDPVPEFLAAARTE